jgi:hypothetical protein
MWWWPSIDDMQRTRDMFERTTTKGTIHFLLGMALLSGILFLVQLTANPDVLDQILEPVISIIVGVIGFAVFFPLFIAIYFSRHFLLRMGEMEREIKRLRAAVEKGGDETD